MIQIMPNVTGAEEEDAPRASIQVTPDARDAFATACKSRAVGRTMTDAASRLLTWFSQQPPPVQTAVLSDVDAGMELHYAAALDLLAHALRERARVIHLSVNHQKKQAPPPSAPARRQ